MLTLEPIKKVGKYKKRMSMQNTYEFHVITNKLRAFFLSKGFIEVPAQSRFSILAACEDPKTMAQYSMTGVNWPLPQTGQMWLERELLEHPEWKGVFCSTTSYRDEPHPIPGRHQRIFPMFEFEQHGDFNDLKTLECEILEYLGFKSPTVIDYETACINYNTEFIEAQHEELLCKEVNQAILLEKFPERTHPFWNMKRLENGIFEKIDVLLYGMETIGSAVRSSDVETMRDCFYTISDGQYAKLLCDSFGQDRVIKELEEYLALPFFSRFGGGIGVTRLAAALKKAGILSNNEISFYGAFKTSVDQLTF